MSSAVHEFTLSIEQQQDYEFRVRFDKPHHADLILDEPAPLGRDAAPNAARVLAAAVGNCLCASLLFCSRKAKAQLGPIQSKVHVQIVRNAAGRLRIGNIKVEIDTGVAESDQEKAKACLGLFEDYCTVTQSIRQGIPVEVSVTGIPGVLNRLGG